jgi:hypothetical protein
MLELPESISILNVERGARVRAQLVRLDRKLAAQQIDGTWWEIAVSKRKRSEEGDHHWTWRKLVGVLRLDLAWDSLAIKSAGGNVEGAMTYRIDAKSQLEPGEGVVYVDRLATAPRNRPSHTKSGRLRRRMPVKTSPVFAAVQAA